MLQLQEKVAALQVWHLTLPSPQILHPVRGIYPTWCTGYIVIKIYTTPTHVTLCCPLFVTHQYSTHLPSCTCSREC